MSLKEAVSGEFTSAVTTKTTKFKNDKLLIKPVSAKKKLETEKQKTKPTFSIRELIFIDVPYYCCADVMEKEAGMIGKPHLSALFAGTESKFAPAQSSGKNESFVSDILLELYVK